MSSVSPLWHCSSPKIICNFTLLQIGMIVLQMPTWLVGCHTCNQVSGVRKVRHLCSGVVIVVDNVHFCTRKLSKIFSANTQWASQVSHVQSGVHCQKNASTFALARVCFLLILFVRLMIFAFKSLRVVPLQKWLTMEVAQSCMTQSF